MNLNPHRFRGNKNETTLTEARRWFHSTVRDGTICPCCDQYCQIYKRTMFSTMARDLIRMLKKGADKEYIRTSRIDNSGNIGKMRHLGLITMGDTRGYWKITETGMMFLQRRHRVPKWFYTWNQECVGYDDSKTIDIIDALGKKFDYDELMNS